MTDDDARAWVGRLRPDELCGDVIGNDEQRLHRFPDDGEWADPSAMREAYEGESPQLIEPAYVGGEHLDLMEFGDVAASPNYPLLVVVDRAVALPEGIDLLLGRACRAHKAAELERLDGAMQSLDESTVIARVVPHIDRWGNGVDDARAGLAMMKRAIAQARAQGVGLLLVGMVVP